MKYIKYFILLFLCVISFFASDQLLLYVENMSPLMQTINEVKDYKEELPVNAIVDGNTIIPGKRGRVINKRETYLKMNEFGSFNETFFVYDYIDPDISLKDNIDKVIIKGNDKSKISLIISSSKFENILKQSKVKYNKIIFKEIENKSSFSEYINGISDANSFIDLNSYLSSNNLNKSICIIGLSNLVQCKNKKYYLVDPNINLYHSNYYKVINELEGASIIFIHDDITLGELKVLLNKINYKKLQPIYLSEMIKE